jgi:hypothetical protein
MIACANLWLADKIVARARKRRSKGRLSVEQNLQLRRHPLRCRAAQVVAARAERSEVNTN